jgi:hypothetical protein
VSIVYSDSSWPQTWHTSNATTLSYTVMPETTVSVNITPLPSPKTEVERLMGEVEAVCALAR